MLKISDAAALALHAMVYMATNPDTIVTTKEVAKALDASDNHLAKVFQRLARQNLVTSARGPSGGYRLTKPPDQISLLEVYEAIEGPLKPSECVLNHPVCDGSICIFGTLLKSSSNMVRTYFATTSLSQLIKVYAKGETT